MRFRTIFTCDVGPMDQGALSTAGRRPPPPAPPPAREALKMTKTPKWMTEILFYLFLPLMYPVVQRLQHPGIVYARAARNR